MYESAIHIPSHTPASGRQNLLAMDDDRALHVSSPGKPAWRELGAYAVYVSMGCPFQLHHADGTSETLDMARVRPFALHRIASTDPVVATVLIEAESIDIGALPCKQGGAYHFGSQRYERFLPFVADRVRAIAGGAAQGKPSSELFAEGLEFALLGEPRRRKALDPRILHVVGRIRQQPEDRYTAQDCARDVDLSLSRFLHLFKAETGVTFRRFLAWKRARGVLPKMTKGSNLTDVALDGGYADSTHFSHSIKRAFGWRPRDMLSDSRSIELISL